MSDLYSMVMGKPENDECYGFVGQESLSLKDVYIAPEINDTYVTA